MASPDHAKRCHRLEGNPKDDRKTDPKVFIELHLKESCYPTHEDICRDEVS